MNTFQDEQDLIFQDFINNMENIFKKSISERRKLFNSAIDRPFLELFITPYCNQSCEYCYLYKYGEQLYPKIDNEIILSNLQILLNYYIEKDLNLYRIDLFSGEIWGYPLGNKVLDILLEYIDKGLKTNVIIIPSNCSFCTDENLLSIIEYYIQAFKEKNIQLIFSISYDGPILDVLNRPFKNDSLDKNSSSYLDRLIYFARKYQYGFHPMISAVNIDKQKQNYDEWIRILKQVYFNPKFQFRVPMQLEVRNDNWTVEAIYSYLDWLNYVIETDIKEFFHNDINLFKQRIIYGDSSAMDNKFDFSYLPYILSASPKNYNCTLGNMLCIRLGDLAIIPCHRTSYEKFVLGYYNIENNKICGVKSNNLQMTNIIYRTGGINNPKCDICFWNATCMRGCLGSQYESTKEILFPVESVCDLQIAKTIFLIEKYIKLNLLDLNNLQEFPSTKEMKFMLKNYRQTKEYQKWNPIIQSILCRNC